jgi:malate dehydrogenase (oxaloacetate-decarboxylating)
MAAHDYFQESIKLHEKLRGKIGVTSKLEITDRDSLSLVYTPGVAEPCRSIALDPSRARQLTIKGNSVAVVTDGSAVLGLGNIGALAAIPVMEGKALLFKMYADIDAWPICLDTQDTDELVETVKRIAPVFGGINLEDIAAPRCFEIERRLQDIGIPVFHDDQHGTAIATLAGLINAAKVTGRKMGDLRVVISGAGASGIAVARLLKCVDFRSDLSSPVKDVILCDSKGIISYQRTDLNSEKESTLSFTNMESKNGSLFDAMKGADVFIGLSRGGLLKPENIRDMAPDPIVLAMANPVPEIMPEEAFEGGAAIVGTGRSDLPNQINNSLVFPGIFRGALDAGAARISEDMKLAAAYALADSVKQPSLDEILPGPLDLSVSPIVSRAVYNAAVTGS